MFRFARFTIRFTLGFAIFCAILIIVFSACATQNIQSQSVSTRLVFEDVMREVCQSAENQQQCFEILATSCEVGDYRNCAILGNAYIGRLDLSKSEDFHTIRDKANALFKKACDGKNGSGCFMLGLYTANDDFVIKGCEYGDFVACNHIVINRNSNPPFAKEVVRWALEREISLLESECKNAELRLKNERNKKCIITRKLVLQDYQEQLQKAQRVKILP